MSTDTRSPNPHLLSGFAPATPADWRRVAEGELGAAAFKTLLSTTAEGIKRQPIYWPSDADLPAVETLPGQAPFLRGSHTSIPADGPWLICQSIRAADPASTNLLAHSALQRGATALDLAPTSADALAEMLTGIDPTAIGLFIVCAPTESLALLQRLGGRIRGAIGADPFALRHAGGTLDLPQAYTALAEATRWASQHAPQMATIQADGSVYHEAGASATEELGYALASAVAQLRALAAVGIPIELAVPQVRFCFAIGTQIFIEIAKLRAARMLWAHAASAFGVPADIAHATIHGRSALRDNTSSEPHNNMLRATVAAFAAALGGVDSLEITPFDAAFRMPDAFSLRMALNTQHLLREESHLGQVIDPAGGAWYIEALTDQFARRAWQFFQEIERDGGMEMRK